MDLREVLNLLGIFCWLTCVCGNQSIPIVQSKSLIPISNSFTAVSGENSEANGCNVLHDFNFPDVTYPTSLLDTCQPFYFNSNSNGLDAIVGPFSSDVKSNYRSLLSSKENKVKDEMSLTTNKSVLKDDTGYMYPIINEDNVFKKYKSEDSPKILTLREGLRKFREKSVIDPELEEILSILYSDETKENQHLCIDDNYLNTYNITDTEINTFLENVRDNIDEIVFLPFEKDTDGYSDSNNSRVNENMSESVNNDVFEQSNVNCIVYENLNEQILNDDMYHDQDYKSYDIDLNIPELILKDYDSYSKSNCSFISENKLEPINADIFGLVNSSNSNKDEGYAFEDHINDLNDPYARQNLSKPLDIDNINYLELKNYVIDENVPEFTDSNFNSFNNSLNIIESIHEDINQLVNHFGDNDRESETTNLDGTTNTIPKEAVVFDVVYKDGYNLENPVLDIVPSNIPVRLKINIEICKPDSNEKDDLHMTEIDDELQTLNPIENNTDLEELNNSIENIGEEELTPQEEITVLDEINDSDFISALSILLIDSLKNKPIEILPSEIINPGNNSNCECGEPSAKDTNLENHEDEKTAKLKFIYSSDNLNSDTNENLIPSEVKFINTSPLIDILSPVIHISKVNDTDNNSNASHVTNYKSDSKEHEDIGGSCVVEEIITSSKDFSTEKAINNITLKEEYREQDLPKCINPTETGPLVNVFQLKIKECSPTIKDVLKES